MPRFFVFFLLLFVLNSPADTRIPWTTSRIIGSPDKPAPYQLVRAFPSLTFTNPVDLTFSTDLNRWFVLEQAGKLYSFPKDGGAPSLAANLASIPEMTESYAIAFDPFFASNRFAYLCYILKPEKPDGTRISRFRVTDDPEPKLDLASQKILITWLSGGHNGCCLKFGNDNYLYISTGDASSPTPPDVLNTGQDISDLLSSILRIDVHHAAGGKNYSIPKDNPFVNDKNARPEVYAYGLRNPWRMGFDKKSGELWVADVGWELWELIYRIQPGGNYGWSIFEGRQPVKPQNPRGPTPILPPIKDHPHSEAASITGGFVYYGKKHPELSGAFIYGDWETGKIWGLRADKEKATWSEELLDSTIRVVSFAEDAGGEIYVLDYNSGIYTLEKNTASNQQLNFPTHLSETGLFSSIEKLDPAPGVYPYTVAAEFWNDGAKAERLVALPGAGTVLAADRPWKFPTNAVLAKTLSLELDPGKPKRVETQLLHFDGVDWRAYSYQWNDSQSDADLVKADGSEKIFEIKERDRPAHPLRWRFHSRTECLRCHNPWCGASLGFQPEQLTDSSRLAGLKLISKNDSPQFHLVNPYDPRADLNQRARSYLHANCSHCHRENAGGSIPSVMNIDAPLDKMKLVNSRPVLGDLGLQNAKVVKPGDPFNSVLLFRTSASGRSRMPYLGSKLVDSRGVSLLREWIASLDSAQNRFTIAPDLLTAKNPNIQNIVAENTRSTSAALRLAHALANPELPFATKEQIAELASKNPNPLIPELFQQYLSNPLTPSDEIAPREQILALKGDASRGSALIHSARLSCLSCHALRGEGKNFGPDLGEVARRQSRIEILDNIREPSKQISPGYTLYLADRDDDEQLTGILVNKTDSEITLRDQTGAETRIPAKNLKSLRQQTLSPMPEGLLRGLTAQEVADLLEAILAAR